MQNAAQSCAPSSRRIPVPRWSCVGSPMRWARVIDCTSGICPAGLISCFQAADFAFSSTVASGIAILAAALQARPVPMFSSGWTSSPEMSSVTGARRRSCALLAGKWKRYGSVRHVRLSYSERVCAKCYFRLVERCFKLFEVLLDAHCDNFAQSDRHGVADQAPDDAKVHLLVLRGELVCLGECLK